MFYKQLELPLESAYDYASGVMAGNMMADDVEEGGCLHAKEHRSGNINNFVCFLNFLVNLSCNCNPSGMTLHQAILEEDTNKIIHLLDSGHSADSLDKGLVSLNACCSIGTNGCI